METTIGVELSRHGDHYKGRSRTETQDRLPVSNMPDAGLFLWGGLYKGAFMKPMQGYLSHVILRKS